MPDSDKPLHQGTEPTYVVVARVENGWAIQVDHTRTYVCRDAAGVVEIVAQVMRVEAEVSRNG